MVMSRCGGVLTGASKHSTFGALVGLVKKRTNPLGSDLIRPAVIQTN